jgi:hypothetical protein
MEKVKSLNKFSRRKKWQQKTAQAVKLLEYINVHAKVAIDQKPVQ